MARSHKLPLRLGPLMSLAMGSVDPLAKAAAKQVKLDFAANPNHYHANGKGKLARAKPRDPRLDLSPRLELRLNVQCEVQEQDSDNGVMDPTMR